MGNVYNIMFIFLYLYDTTYLDTFILYTCLHYLYIFGQYLIIL